MREYYLYTWMGRRKPIAAGRIEFFRSGIQAGATKWWIVRAENAQHARLLIKSKLLSDGVGPGITDSNVIPSLIQARIERAQRRERQAHTEQVGPREGLPIHEMPGGMPVQVFSSPHLTWGTMAPYWMGQPKGVRHGFADIPYIEIKVAAPEGVLREGGLIPIARQKAMGLADVMGWSLAFVPMVGTGRRRRFKDQHGMSRMGTEGTIRFQIIGGLDWKEKMALGGY